jgi:hypothetical protein
MTRIIPNTETYVTFFLNFFENPHKNAVETTECFNRILNIGPGTELF